jgi:hypothetical protein
MLSGSMAIGRNDDAYGWFGAFYTIPSSGFGDIKRIVSPQHRCVQQIALDYRRNAEACRHYDPFRQAVDPLRRKLRPNSVGYYTRIGQSHAWKKYGELLPTNAPRDRAVRHQISQNTRELSDDLVARMMAKGIVNEFESINVREDQRSEVMVAQVAQEGRDTTRAEDDGTHSGISAGNG